MFADVPYDVPGSQPSNGRIYKHRDLAQRMLGRTLLPGECVIRKDGNFYNYSYDNLMVFKTVGCVRRWNSPMREEFLFRHNDGVYDYDWDNIPQKKYYEGGQKQAKRLEEVRTYLRDNPSVSLKELAEHFDILPESMRRYVKVHSLMLAPGKVVSNKLLTMPRKQLIRELANTSTAELMATYNIKDVNTLLRYLGRRGLSLKGKHHKFKHLNKEDILNAITQYKIKTKVCQHLKVFEENLDVELAKHGIETGYYVSFVHDGYIMPNEEDYAINDGSEEETLVSVFLSDLSLSDVLFLTGKTKIKDILPTTLYNQNKIERFIQMKRILNKENVFALIQNGYSIKDIADIYNFDYEIVQHLCQHV